MITVQEILAVGLGVTGSAEQAKHYSFMSSWIVEGKKGKEEKRKNPMTFYMQHFTEKGYHNESK